MSLSLRDMVDVKAMIKDNDYISIFLLLSGVILFGFYDIKQAICLFACSVFWRALFTVRKEEKEKQEVEEFHDNINSWIQDRREQAMMPKIYFSKDGMSPNSKLEIWEKSMDKLIKEGKVFQDAQGYYISKEIK